MSTDRPNILIITTDQQRIDSLSCYGSTFTHTPHLDQLASEGVRLNRAYCANPVCTPSRVSLFTGKQVSRHGVWNVGVNCPDQTQMISHLLADAGFRTHYVGKAHFQAFGLSGQQSRESRNDWAVGYDGWDGPYYGFQTAELALGHTTYGLSGHYGAWVRSQVSPAEIESWETSQPLGNADFGGNAHDWSIPLKNHNSVWTADRTIAFLKEHDPAQPFMMAVGFQDPHHPHALPTEFEDRVDPDQVPLPNFTESELADKPPHFMEAHLGHLDQSAIRGAYPVAGQGAGHAYGDIAEADVRLGRAYYYSMVKLIDQQCGRILTALADLGLADNTLVVFTSDHGELLGDHGLWMKGPFHYESLINVPTIIRWPNGFKPQPASDALFSLVDIAPTCLAAADVTLPDDMDGLNMLPLLRGERAALRDYVLVETVDDPHKLRLKTVVTANQKLTWYADHPYGELYDLAEDPDETINQWDQAEFSNAKLRLFDLLIQQAEAIEPRLPRLAYA